LRVFSNAPSFAYTYAYVLSERDVTISYLEDALPHKFYTDAPSVRNPDETVNYEKTVVMAIYHVRANDLLARNNVTNLGIVTSKKIVREKVRSLDTIMADRDSKEKLQTKKKKAEKETANATRKKEIEATRSSTPIKARPGVRSAVKASRPAARSAIRKK
jgi:hypothetical protein